MLSADGLAAIRTIDITTIGRKTGQPSRIEIWWFHIDGRFVIAGTPGPRDWLANVRADPAIIVHAGGHDHPGTAAVVSDPERRRAILTHPDTSWYADQTDLDNLLADAPIIELTLDLG